MKMNKMKTNNKSGYLAEHAERFTKRVEKVHDGIYSAIGYGLANSILLVTNEGNIIVDTTESIEAAKEIRTEFNRISPQPTAAIIYTHGHTDHIRGASVFMDKGTKVYAHAKTKEFFNQQFNQLDPILTRRGARQFGVRVPRKYIPSSGLGPYLQVDRSKPQIILPTEEFNDSLELTIGDLKLMLVSAPGETDDQIFVWLPEKKVLLSADNYYPCFPNLYTIRGTTPRPVYQWIESLDKMRDLQAEYLVPSHTEPVYGSERINELLTMYRDAIQYIHDSVVRGMNQGKTPDEMVEEITLPSHLAAYKELRELYGDVSQSNRAIYDGYLGWFDGNATNLVPLNYKVRAKKIIGLAGGYERMLLEARNALDEEEYQWAAELSDLLLAVSPGDSDILSVKSEALFQLGLASQNSNNRSYYLSQSLEIKGDINYHPRSKEVQFAYANSMPIEQFFSQMAILLDPIKSKNETIHVCVKMIDSNVTYQVHVRRGVAEVREGEPQSSELEIGTTEKVWKEMIIGISDVQQALNEGNIQLQGDYNLFNRFVNLFQ
ncbi:alkyl sulfatase dimerization domain-containing protein [Oceanobacillus sp. Castelsardo]|uniref:alkyl sulfatase dimerization domain-containing protein n=1 Tax=Oceanobacillus sp. Castelsardo TaxID=1851204 RepID=UPI0008392841|nr:alkyl sulfatase dimerization domain-containing protein [Oceanobacillus sp. Castelsardo]